METLKLAKAINTEDLEHVDSSYQKVRDVDLIKKNPVMSKFCVEKKKTHVGMSQKANSGTTGSKSSLSLRS